MAILFHCTWVEDGELIREGLQAALPGLEIRVWPNVGDVDDIEYAVVWNLPKGELAKLPNLKLILSPGAGVDHLFSDPYLPCKIPITRIVDPLMADRMAEYAAALTLWSHRRFDVYGQQQQNREWRPVHHTDAQDRTVGILGLGALGVVTARRLSAFRFQIRGWSRSMKIEEGIVSFFGNDALPEFLSGCEILICLLPLTSKTAGILNSVTFNCLPIGAYVVNCGRGQLIVEEDLLDALDSGRLSGAALDVFEEEPLPQNNAFWGHPKIRITPHVSSLTAPTTAVPILAEQIRKFEAGEMLDNLVDWDQGY